MHSVCFFQYVYRKAINQHVAVILCKKNREKNKSIKNRGPGHNEPAQKHQYTLTILPSDILPYARFLTEKILSAIDHYEAGTCTSYQAAALHMGAENEKTFKKYYLRAQNNLAFWFAEASERVSAAASKILMQTGPLKNIWPTYNALIDAYGEERNKIPGTFDVFSGNTQEHFQAYFAQYGKGLSPERAVCPHPVRALGPPIFF